MKKLKQTYLTDSKISIKVIHGNLRVYMNEILHLSIQTGEFFGVQSYIKDNIFHIEYYVSSTVIETEYVNINDWKNILKELEKLKFI